MARLWSSGFELNTTSADVEWAYTSGTLPTIQTTTVRSGTYALQITSLGSTIPIDIAYTFKTPDGNGPYFFRVYLRVATRPSAENRIIDITGDNFGASEIKITLDNTGALRLRDEDGVIGSASSALALNTWYRIEIEVDLTPAAGSDIVRARIDGVEFAGA